MQHLLQNCSIHPPIRPEKLTRGQPEEGARVEEGIISPSRNTFLSARQGNSTAGDGSRHSPEPLATEYSQSRSRVPEEVQGMGSRSGLVKGDCYCDAEGRPGRRGVLTPTKSIVELPAEIVETQAKSVSVESISGEFVELTPPALAEGASTLPADSVVAASGGPLVDTSFDPIHATRIEITAAKEEKEERLGNSAQVSQPTRISELQPTETPKQFVREPASVVGGPLGNQGTLTALPGGCAAIPQKIPRLLPEFLVDPVLMSPKPPVDQLSVVPLGESIDEPVTGHLPTEPITMEPVTEPVAETATKPDIGSVSDIVSGPVTEPTVEVYVTSSALQQRVADTVQPTVSSMLNVLDIRIPRTSNFSVAPAVTSPHIQLGESVGPVPQKKTSESEPSPIVPPSGSVGIETALQAPLPFSKPSHFAIGFLRNPSVSKLFRSLKHRVLSKKSREDKTPNLLPVPPSPVRPSLGDTAPTQTNTPLPLSSVNDLSSLDDGGESRIPTKYSIEDSRGGWKSLPMPSPDPSIPPTTHWKQTSQGLQSRHSATQVAYRRAVALRALELQQIREDEREVARLRGGGCCGGGGGGKSIDPTPHQAGTGLPLPTEKPPVAPPPLVTPRTSKPGEPPQADPSRSRTQSQTAPQRSRAQSHASQRTNKPGAESRSRRGSQATLKEAASVSRQPSQREIRSRTISQAEPRSRKQSRVGEPGTSSQTRGARSRTTSKAPGVPPLPSMS